MTIDNIKIKKGQEIKEYLGITYEDLLEIFERVNKHVGHQIESL